MTTENAYYVSNPASVYLCVCVCVWACAYRRQSWLAFLYRDRKEVFSSKRQRYSRFIQIDRTK